MITARLAATAAAPLDPASADAPQVLHWPGRTLLVQRGDTELVVLDLEADGRPVRFPAPWPRRFGWATVSPEGDAAVFAGLHAVRAVKPNGATRWEVRHGCWGECSRLHASYAEYADDEDHRYPDSGSAAVSADGKLVWAHVRGPLMPGEDDEELWLVLDAVDGSILARAGTGTVASGSYPVPHPDPTQMGLSIGEGEEGSPTLWGRWDGRQLLLNRIGDELILMAVSPSGRHFLTVDIGQWTLHVHAADGTLLRGLDAQGAVPLHPESAGDYRVYWDYEAAFVDEETVIAGTSESEARYGTARHWMIDVRAMAVSGEVAYPFPVSGSPRPAGNGTWYTISADRTSLHLWRAD